MDSYPAPDPGRKRLNLVKALGIEVSVIVLLAVVLGVVLNYFKVIDLGLFKTDKSVGSQVIPSTSNPTTTPDKPLVQRNFDIILRNKAWLYVDTISEFEGELLSVDLKGGVEKETGLPYKLKLDIGVGKEKEKISQYYSSISVNKIKILDSKGSEVEVDRLKAGDKIKIKTSLSAIEIGEKKIKEVVITIL